VGLLRAPGAGRKPLPTALKVLRGNPGNQVLPENEPVYEAKLPTAPAELTPLAKQVWRREGKRLLEQGVFQVVDAAVFAAFCQSYARWLEITATLNKTGLVVKDDKGGFKMNPLLQAARDAQADFIRASVEFGLTPSSRSRVTAVKPKESNDEWWLGQ
jgi:P27 family predicted phage terminase small subunit